MLKKKHRQTPTDRVSYLILSAVVLFPVLGLRHARKSIFILGLEVGYNSVLLTWKYRYLKAENRERYAKNRRHLKKDKSWFEKQTKKLHCTMCTEAKAGSTTKLTASSKTRLVI